MKSVIFDLDGTLVDSQPLQFKAYRLAFEEVGLSLDWHDWVKYWVQMSISAYDWLDIKGLIFDADAVRARKKFLYERLIKDELELKPGVMTLLNGLKLSGYKLAIASSSRIESIELIVDKFFPDFFEVLQSDANLPKSKPDPEVFLKAADKLGGDNAKNTLIVEDSVSGYKAAIAAGFPCVMCPDVTVGGVYDFSEAVMVVDSLEDLSVEDLDVILGV